MILPRRKFNIGLLGIAASYLLSSRSLLAQNTQSCITTEEDAEGPFYLSGSPNRSNLVQEGHATEDVIWVQGRVLKQCGTPAANAVIDIWHANPNGRYESFLEGDSFRGNVQADTNGNYQFKTLMPGKYQGRPRHIHIKIFDDNAEALTTQLYFSEFAEENQKDWLFRNRSGKDRLLVLDKSDNQVLRGSFDFVLA